MPQPAAVPHYVLHQIHTPRRYRSSLRIGWAACFLLFSSLIKPTVLSCLSVSPSLLASTASPIYIYRINSFVHLRSLCLFSIPQIGSTTAHHSPLSYQPRLLQNNALTACPGFLITRLVYQYIATCKYIVVPMLLLIKTAPFSLSSHHLTCLTN